MHYLYQEGLSKTKQISKVCPANFSITNAQVASLQHSTAPADYCTQCFKIPVQCEESSKVQIDSNRVDTNFLQQQCAKFSPIKNSLVLCSSCPVVRDIMDVIRTHVL